MLSRSKISGHSRSLYSPDYDRLDASTAKRVDELRSEMEKIVCRETQEGSILGFREVFERYVGLTAETLAGDRDVASPFTEIGQSSEESSKLNGICLNRRNRRQLEFHQIRARNDFLTFAADLSAELEHLGIELSRLLLDDEGLEALKIDQISASQGEAEPSVINLESEVWPSKAHRQSASGGI